MLARQRKAEEVEQGLLLDEEELQARARTIDARMAELTRLYAQVRAHSSGEAL